MNTGNFEELLGSVKEVGLMERGELAPSREFIVEKKIASNAADVKTFAICLVNDDEELIPLKIYQVVLSPRHETCTVKDESNETLVCPMNWFLPVEFPANVAQLLEETELALA